MMGNVISAFARGRSVLEPEDSAGFLSRWLFLRLLGIIYLIAFLSLWTQIDGLVGHDGILPVADYLKAAGQQSGPERYWWLPTFCWFKASDQSLHVQCAAGVVTSSLLIVGVAPIFDLVLLWAIYLSLSTVCRDFLSFQWDILLLETGFLAIFLAPRQWLPKGSGESAPSFTVLWLCRWLLFRLMFMSGVVKLLSNDPTWWNLTALTIHYETQPLPTWLGWYAHQLPVWVHKLSVAVMFVIELAAPFLIFCGRRARQWACGAFVLLMLLISLTGNYCFFNLLTVTLCVLLLDDAFLLRFLPAPMITFLNARLMNPSLTPPERKTDRTQTDACSPPGREPNELCAGIAPLDLRPAASPQSYPPASGRGRPKGGGDSLRVIRTVGVGVLAAFILLVSAGETAARLFGSQNLPGPLLGLLRWVSPLRTVNSYGLFAVMTNLRPEIVVEGSDDGVAWLAYEFKWKPGELKRRPAFVAPHQPRLDWQMWFAALGDYRGNPWFVNFLVCLLRGSPEVLVLLEKNPFPDKPPRYLRAVLYEYHFTDFATRRLTGAWWRRERKGLYCPEISLRQPKA
jgi:lipase maturation factor 1